MPSLPKRNQLDYNPNSIINASKKITAISLENLKNPVLDPDQKTLSTLEASKKLDDSFDKLRDLAGLFKSGVLRIQSVLSSAYSDVLGTRTIQFQSPSGRGRTGLRKIGGANGSEYSDDFESSSARSVSTSPSLAEYQRRLASDRQRFRNYYPNDDRNSTARISIDTSFIDDDASSGVPDERDFEDIYTPFTPLGRRQSETPATANRTRNPFRSERNLPSLIFFLIQTIRRMDILITSRIRPVISQLSQPQIDFLTELYNEIDSSYNSILFPFSGIIRKNIPHPLSGLAVPFNTLGEYGDEIFNTFDTERKKLLLNIKVIINAWKQNTPMGQMSEEIPAEMVEKPEDWSESVAEIRAERVAEGAGRRRRGRPRKAEMTLVGSGRNFYGEKVDDSRDIPTIYSQLGVKNCPTKYLL